MSKALEIVHEGVMQALTQIVDDALEVNCVMNNLGCPECFAMEFYMINAVTRMSYHRRPMDSADQETFIADMTASFTKLLTEACNAAENFKRNNPTPTHAGPSTPQ